MNPSNQTILMGWLSLLLLGAGVAGALYTTLSDPDSPLARFYAAYSKGLDAELKLLFIQDTTGKHIANVQIAAILGSLVLEAVTALLGFEIPPVALIVIPLAIAGPKLWLIDARTKRQSKIEQQLDTFLTALANALKASPSLGDALNATAYLLRSPIREEIELTVKENQLGMPLDQAILNMGQRVGSMSFAGALSTVLIGRQTGGDLPRILETSAATLREMARLEGVVRTKTAEGKAQAWVLGVMPVFLVGILQWIDPEWLKPLFSTFVGGIIIGIAIFFWVAAIVAARKILAVDI